MTTQTKLGGAFKLAGNRRLTVNRMGYGAMKLTGPECGDRPKMGNCGDRAVARSGQLAGVNHIDT